MTADHPISLHERKQRTQRLESSGRATRTNILLEWEIFSRLFHAEARVAQGSTLH
jgi:hypothetical protein